MISAPGFANQSERFESIAGSFEKYPLLAAVWQQLQIERSDFLNIVLDSGNFYSADRGKIGLGSSSALTVALTAALQSLVADDASTRDVALAAHRELQGGNGSGADIACCVAGGLIEYRMGAPGSKTLDWPDGLRYALLWSGVPVDTRTQLRKFGQIEARHSRSELSDSAEVLSQSFSSRDTQQILHDLREYTALLRRFDVDHELGIFDAGHAVLADMTNSSELVYKPCGAGGGDLGIALASDAESLAAFVEAARAQNFTPLDLMMDTTGVVLKDAISE